MSSETQPPVIRSNWWITHVFLFTWVGVLYVALLAVEFGPISLSRSAAILAVQGWVFVFVLFFVASLLGFYYDAKAIEAADRGWQPRWWLYVAGTLLLTPAVTAPLYLARRQRYVGIPWSKLFLKGRKD